VPNVPASPTLDNDLTTQVPSDFARVQQLGQAPGLGAPVSCLALNWVLYGTVLARLRDHPDMCAYAGVESIAARTTPRSAAWPASSYLSLALPLPGLSLSRLSCRGGLHHACRPGHDLHISRQVGQVVGGRRPWPRTVCGGPAGCWCRCRQHAGGGPGLQVLVRQVAGPAMPWARR
jgi:hypothetical protein